MPFGCAVIIADCTGSLFTNIVAIVLASHPQVSGRKIAWTCSKCIDFSSCGIPQHLPNWRRLVFFPCSLQNFIRKIILDHLSSMAPNLVANTLATWAAASKLMINKSKQMVNYGNCLFIVYHGNCLFKITFRQYVVICLTSQIRLAKTSNYGWILWNKL